MAVAWREALSITSVKVHNTALAALRHRKVKTGYQQKQHVSKRTRKNDVTKTKIMDKPKVAFGSLTQADGSASLTAGGFSILASVNGPIEVQRRDELPSEAFLEVNVREASGGGSPRTRHLELLLHDTLRPLILTEQHPRTLIQMTFQVLSSPEDAFSAAPAAQSDSVLPIIAHLLNAGVCALLNGNVPMRSVAVAVALVTTRTESSDTDRRTELLGGSSHLVNALSDSMQAMHVFAFTSQREMLLCESEGSYTLSEWQAAASVAESACVGSAKDASGSMVQWLRAQVGHELEKASRWRG